MFDPLGGLSPNTQKEYFEYVADGYMRIMNGSRANIFRYFDERSAPAHESQTCDGVSAHAFKSELYRIVLCSGFGSVRRGFHEDEDVWVLFHELTHAIGGAAHGRGGRALAPDRFASDLARGPEIQMLAHERPALASINADSLTYAAFVIGGYIQPFAGLSPWER